MRKFLCTLALIIAPTTVFADAPAFTHLSPEDPTATEPEQATHRAARVISRAAPTFPEVAVKKGIEGHVVIRYSVLADGTVGDAQVIESTPPGVFDRSALAAIRRFQFEPAKVSGEPVAVEDMRQRISFRLTNPWERPRF